MDRKKTEQNNDSDLSVLGLSSINVFLNFNGDVCIAQNQPPKERVVIVVPQSVCGLLVDFINIYSSYKE